ncbi:hypothetical protein Tco_0783624 [Tanacetum coccineum]
MTCSLSHTVDEIKVMVRKQIEEDKLRQLAIMNLVVEFENASIAKDNLRKTYDECSYIPQEKRASIDTYLKPESDKDYEMHSVLRFGYGSRTGGGNDELVSLLLERVRLRRPEIIRLSSPDNPLVDHGREILERLTGADMRNAMKIIAASTSCIAT